VVISDAGSTDGTRDAIIDKFPAKVTVIPIDSSNWWAGGMNACIRYVLTVGEETDYVYTLNNDTELAPDCLEKLIDFAINNPRHIIGTLNLFYGNRNRIEPSAFINRKFFIFHYKRRLFSFGQTIPAEVKNYYPVDTLSGKGVLLPLVVFRENGLYAEELLPHYHADGELVERNRSMNYMPVILMSAYLFSHISETGIGTLEKNPIIFYRSFFSKRSANHLLSLYHYSKLVYKKQWMLYFIPKVLIINLGFLKRPINLR